MRKQQVDDSNPFGGSSFPSHRRLLYKERPTHAERGVLSSVGDASRLAKAGMNVERPAMGPTVKRYELVANMLSPMIYDLVDLFETVNALDDPQARVSAWARQADAIVVEYIPRTCDGSWTEAALPQVGFNGWYSTPC